MFELKVYLDDGRIFIYDVESEDKIREHSNAIIKDGYRHNSGEVYEHYPPHRILKVKCSNTVNTEYPDRISGT